MSTNRVPQANSPLEQTWRERVTRCKANGLSVRAFSRHASLSQLSSWHGAIAERDTVSAAPSTPAFVPVHVLPVASPPVLELVLRSGHVCCIPDGSYPKQLCAVLAALETTQ